MGRGLSQYMKSILRETANAIGTRINREGYLSEIKTGTTIIYDMKDNSRINIGSISFSEARTEVPKLPIPESEKNILLNILRDMEIDSKNEKSKQQDWKSRLGQAADLSLIGLDFINRFGQSIGLL